MEALKVESLRKNFGGVAALVNLSLSVEEGECKAIIGLNGAGKTTLLNLITGQLHPSAGQIYVFGRNVTNMPLHKRVHLGLGRTFQVTNLFLNLTILDNVLLAIKVGKPFRTGLFRPLNTYNSLFDEARELLDRWGFWEKRDMALKALSHGEQRRMELVVSLASKPNLILLDEPTAGLSEAEIANLTVMIKSIKQDATLLIVAHDMDFVFDVADTVAVLHYGELITEGKGEEIKADPRVREIYLGTEEAADAPSG